jgi:hypothetical protein
VHRRLALLLMPILLGAGDLTVDHVTVAGKDLKAMMSNLAAVGLKCEYGGAHSNDATEMALTMRIAEVAAQVEQLKARGIAARPPNKQEFQRHQESL